MSDSTGHYPGSVLPCDECPAEIDDCAKKKLRGTQRCLDMIETYTTTYLPVIRGTTPEETPFDHAVSLMVQIRETHDKLYRLTGELKSHLTDHGISRSSVKEHVNKMEITNKRARYKERGIHA